jgi:hypothetical protein
MTLSLRDNGLLTVTRTWNFTPGEKPCRMAKLQAWGETPGLAGYPAAYSK